MPEIKNFIFRLSLYHRVLENIPNEFESISSYELAELSGVNAPQVRKDLNQFGQFGTRGKGYETKELKQHLQKILGLDKKWDMALVGVGYLGSALLLYPGFRKHGFEICFAFDNNLAKIGKRLEGIEIQDQSEIKDTIKENKIKLAIVTVPASNAQEVTNILVDSGIKGILNFAPVKINVPQARLREEVKVVNVDLSIQLETLSFYLSKN